MGQLIFKKAPEFEFCEIEYYTYKIVLINYKTRISVRLIVDLIDEPFFTFKNKIYPINAFEKIDGSGFPSWFSEMSDKKFYEKTKNPKFTLEEKFFLNGMLKKEETFFKKQGFLN